VGETGAMGGGDGADRVARGEGDGEVINGDFYCILNRILKKVCNGVRRCKDLYC
jgi:hypothetical protein